MAKYSILVVEDEYEARNVIRSGLESLGPDFEVFEVPSGEEAYLVDSRQAIDLLVIDIRLAGISGLELMHKVRDRNPELKIILVTGLTDPEIKQQVAEAGAYAYFYKPVNMADFLDTVERCLGVVETIFPELPISEIEAEEPPRGLSEHLISLRQELDALSVILFDERGQILAQAGDLPAATDSSLIPVLVATFSASTKVSFFLGMKSPENYFLFTGDSYDLYMASIGQSLFLLVSTEPRLRDETSGLVIESLRPAVNELLNILTGIGVPLQPPEEVLVESTASETLPEEDQDSPDLDLIFEKANEQQLSSQEVDDFWDMIDEAGTSGAPTAGALSYDQARQLGLAPDNDDQ